MLPAMESTCPSSPTGVGRPGYLQLLRECPGFRLLFASRSISLFGDWFSLIAVVALLREVTGSSPTALSGVLILKLLPLFLAAPPAGVVADRFSRKAVMVISDAARVVLVLAMIAAPWLPQPMLWVYGLVLLQVTAAAFFEPARGAALPQVVPDRYLSTANAMGAIVWSVMFTLGALLGGVVTDLVGWRAALGVDAATYLVSALLVARLQLPRRKARASGPVDWQRVTGWRDFRAGLAFVARRRELASVLFLKTGWGIAGAITLFLTLFGEREYALSGRPDLGVSLMYVARALGTGIGPLLVRRFLPDESPTQLRWLLFSCLLWPGVWYGVFTYLHDPWLAAGAVMLAHFGGSVLWVYSTVLLQRLTPDEYRGRVMAADLGFATLSISISTGVYGVVAAAPGADMRILLRWLALSLVAPAAIWLFASKRWPVGATTEQGRG